MARIGNCIMAGLGPVLGIMCLEVPFSIYNAIFGFFSMAFLAAGGNIQNDIIDQKVDIVNNRPRPLVLGQVSASTARIWFSGSYGVGIFFAAFISHYHIVAALIIILLLFLYNHKLKSQPLIGNIAIAVLCSLAVYFPEWPGGMYATLLPCIFAFLTTMAREIAKDAEDIRGDSVSDYQTLPLVFGIEKSRYLVRLILIIVLIMLPVPALFFNYHYSYTICLPFLLILWFQPFRSLSATSLDWPKAQNGLKKLIIGGMAAIALAHAF